jgi:hypothetical protein
VQFLLHELENLGFTNTTFNGFLIKEFGTDRDEIIRQLQGFYKEAPPPERK